jgi:hypothetical protein
MTFDATFVDWLKNRARFAEDFDSAVDSKWSERARGSEIVSCIAIKADAEAEANRQLSFLAGPLVVDRHRIKGRRDDLLGEPVTLGIDKLGYAAGEACFVIGVEEAETGDETYLTVVRTL